MRRFLLALFVMLLCASSASAQWVPGRWWNGRWVPGYYVTRPGDYPMSPYPTARPYGGYRATDIDYNSLYRARYGDRFRLTPR